MRHKCGTIRVMDVDAKKNPTNTEIYLLLSNTTQLSNAPLCVCQCLNKILDNMYFGTDRCCII